MSASELPVEIVSEPMPEDLVEAGIYATFADASAHGLVVLAADYPYWLVPADDRYRLLVEPRAFANVRRQLVCFDRESVGWPPRPIAEAAPSHPVEFATPLLWALTVFTLFVGQLRHPDWVEFGGLDAQGVFARGEWWRPVTALFLHADVAHVLSNALRGIFVFAAVLTTVGRRRGWVLIALAAIAGNLASAALNYPGPYRSIGASTAIFAGLGLLTGRAIRLVARSDHPHRWRTMFVPLGAGLTVLGLYGAGEMHTDIIAHLTGFMAGLGGGFFWALSRNAASATTAPHV